MLEMRVRKGVTGHPYKDVQPDGGGGQPKADDPERGGGGLHLNRTTTSEDFEQIFCVSVSEDPHGLPDRQICCVEDVFRATSLINDPIYT